MKDNQNDQYVRRFLRSGILCTGKAYDENLLPAVQEGPRKKEGVEKPFWGRGEEGWSRDLRGRGGLRKKILAERTGLPKRNDGGDFL